MFLGARKRGRFLAIGVLAGLSLLIAAPWQAGDRERAGSATEAPEVAAFESASRAGAPGPSSRAGWRKATPVTRGQDLGFRFRPDERAPAQGEVIAPGGVQGEPREQADFRPIEPRRKPTYEELQAREQVSGSVAPPPSVPAMPYPMLPPPPPPFFPVAPW